MSQRDAILIEACVLSLASNIRPSHYLKKAEDWLSSLGQLTLSTINSNQDNNVKNEELKKNSLTLAIYSNQVALLVFDKPIDYFQWVAMTKNFEQQQDRQLYNKPTVTLDIDVIAIRLAEQLHSIESLVDEKGDNFLLLSHLLSHQDRVWLGIDRRFPLACYDKTGIEDLSQKIALSFIPHD